MRNNTLMLISIIILTVIALYIALPIDHPAWLERGVSPGTETTRELRDIKLGLDLRGGTQVLLEANPAPGQEVDSGAMDTAKLIVENRVNGLGVAEAVVQRQGEDRLIVELPGVDNADQAVETIRSTGQLEFIDAAGMPLSQGMIINTSNHPTKASDYQTSVDAGVASPAAIPYPDQVFETVMTGDILRNALAVQDQLGQWEIGFELTNAGSDAFYNYTSTHIGQPLAIVLDGQVLSAPTINAGIRDQGVITGQFTQQEADSLGVQMRYGALPVPLSVADISTIGASLGQDSVESSLIAGLIGMAAVFLFMLIIYRLPGFIADIALIIYIVLNVAVYKLVPVTLTLAGIAGFLLSIGMAVDANILIFERMKEEIRVGRSVRLAVEAGFSRAWPAIRDGNLSTLISCGVLFWFGNTFGASVVKGFAVTLAIGVLLSMFTAVFITRTFMRTMLSSRSKALAESHTLLGV
ncbi:MAG: protein translocase subunit SecD [Caldilineaceae bacterium]|nr:protein translocase subunit SecD [Caldilineaceae bacterium]MCB9137597.1 protein translocase subunit SecD [Caldilineaceae bacterium]